MSAARTAPTDRMRGAAVGALTAAMAVAGHGFAGGGFPSSAALTLLVLGCAGVGALAGSIRGGGVLALLGALACGQLVGHLALSTALTHQHAGADLSARGLSMLLWHAAATAVCATLIRAAERLYGPVTRVLRALLRPVPAPPRPTGSALRAVAVGGAEPVLLDFAISRRGPPAAACA
ncbi:hypothetical protein [Rhodococcus kronopolitis]|uniref:MFS transporter n=1 Tax=Rhodococcus kronopolitis TaxID=1460226 RepID=A0ABV9FZW8_9NOCA